MYITFMFLCFFFFCLLVYSATRAKMSMMSSMSKIRGGDKGPGYIQTEVILGESMQKFGRELGEESCFGNASFAINIHDVGAFSLVGSSSTYGTVLTYTM